jgi:transketolase
MVSAPTLICCKTTIGFGSPNKAGTHECHGAALGQAEINLTKAALGWDHEAFIIPDNVYAGWDAKAKGAKAEADWNAKFAAYKAAHPELAAEYERRMAGKLPANWKEATDALIADVNAKAENLASRQASQKVIAD